MNKNGVKKKKRDPNALRRYIANILFLVAQVFIRLSSKILSEDKGLVLQSQVRDIKNRWKHQRKELLCGLILIYQNYEMMDVFDVSEEWLNLEKHLLPSACDVISMIDCMVDRYEDMIGMCRTRQDVKALSSCLEGDYHKILADTMQRITRFEEYVTRRKKSQVFVNKVRVFQKELADPFWRTVLSTARKGKKVKMEPSLNMLEHILEDWEQTKCQNTISMFDTFYYNIKHREQLIDRLWERIIPKSNFSFDEYDSRRDDWHCIPYQYEQFH